MISEPFKDMQKTLYSDPEAAKFMSPATMHHMQIFMAIFLALSLSMLIASIALLKRKQWGRLLFIILLIIGIIWSFGKVFFPKLIYTWFMPGFEGKGALNMQEIYRISHITSIIFGIGSIVIFAWIIKKLISKDIRQEFLK